VTEFRQMLMELEAEILSLLKHQDQVLRSDRGR
jgi:hypothetical protein